MGVVRDYSWYRDKCLEHTICIQRNTDDSKRIFVDEKLASSLERTAEGYLHYCSTEREDIL